MNKDEDDDDDANSELTSCGFGSWRPKWLQRFATPVAFLVNISLVGIVQGIASALFYSTANTLEKRYHYDSKITSYVLIADNIANIIVSLKCFIYLLSINLFLIFFRYPQLLAIMGHALIDLGWLVMAKCCLAFLVSLPLFHILFMVP